MFTPGVVAIFTLGLFWKRATEIGGLIAVVSSVVISLIWPLIFPDMPFMNRVGYVFLISLALGAISSFLQKPHGEDKVVDLAGLSFVTDRTFNIGAVIIVVLLIAFYGYWW